MMGLFGKWMASKSSLGGFAFTTYVGLSPRNPYACGGALPIKKGMLAAGLLPIVEDRYDFLCRDYGFNLAQTSFLPVGAWYRADGRAVVLSFDFSAHPALEISLEDGARDRKHALAELLGTPPNGAAVEPDRTHESLAAEMDRLGAILRERCEPFLAGDLEAFRRAFREPILVQACRNAALDAFYIGDLKRAAALFSDLRDYWTESDRELHARAVSGQSQPRFRLGRR
jgi:hypothetical protein